MNESNLKEDTLGISPCNKFNSHSISDKIHSSDDSWSIANNLKLNSNHSFQNKNQKSFKHYNNFKHSNDNFEYPNYNREHRNNNSKHNETKRILNSNIACINNKQQIDNNMTLGKVEEGKMEDKSLPQHHHFIKSQYFNKNLSNNYLPTISKQTKGNKFDPSDFKSFPHFSNKINEENLSKKRINNHTTYPASEKVLRTNEFNSNENELVSTKKTKVDNGKSKISHSNGFNHPPSNTAFIDKQNETTHNQPLNEENHERTGTSLTSQLTESTTSILPSENKNFVSKRNHFLLERFFNEKEFTEGDNGGDSNEDVSKEEGDDIKLSEVSENQERSDSKTSSQGTEPLSSQHSSIVTSPVSSSPTSSTAPSNDHSKHLPNFFFNSFEFFKLVHLSYHYYQQMQIQQQKQQQYSLNYPSYPLLNTHPFLDPWWFVRYYNQFNNDKSDGNIFKGNAFSTSQQTTTTTSTYNFAKMPSDAVQHRDNNENHTPEAPKNQNNQLPASFSFLNNNTTHSKNELSENKNIDKKLSADSNYLNYTNPYYNYLLLHSSNNNDNYWNLFKQPNQNSNVPIFNNTKNNIHLDNKSAKPLVTQKRSREICRMVSLSDGRSVYHCSQCRKSFNSASEANKHVDFHDDIRPFKCKFCSYYARTNSQLKVHMMRHQGIRMYVCHLCNYKGVTQSDLNRHTKSQIHVLKSRNECSQCSEGFVSPMNLAQHCKDRHPSGL